jgi:hypothetical protein
MESCKGFLSSSFLAMPANIRLGWMYLRVVNTSLAAKITPVKNFIIQAPGSKF